MASWRAPRSRSPKATRAPAGCACTTSTSTGWERAPTSALFAWEDYLDDVSLTFVEWPEAGAAELPPADVDVLLTHRTPESRGLELRAAPPFERALAGEMTAAGIGGDAHRAGAPDAAGRATA